MDDLDPEDHVMAATHETEPGQKDKKIVSNFF